MPTRFGKTSNQKIKNNSTNAGRTQVAQFDRGNISNNNPIKKLKLMRKNTRIDLMIFLYRYHFAGFNIAFLASLATEVLWDGMDTG